MGLFHHLGRVVADEELEGPPPPPPPADEAPAGGGANVGDPPPTGEIAREQAADAAAKAQHDADVARTESEHREDRAAQQHQWDVENARAAEPQQTAPAAPGAPYPTPPAQQQAIDAGTPAGPGGVVPYVGEGGGVRVGMPRSEVSHTLAAKQVKRK